MKHLMTLATSLEGLHLIKRNSIADSRGSFERMFCQDELNSFLHSKTIQQVNRSFTVLEGTVRGMHFQHPPHSETKIVSCLKGRVWDVAIDLRRGSPTFLQWHGEVLDEKNCRSIIIPEGFAHGFQTLEANCVMLYFHTAVYETASESAINALDPRIGIEWPKQIAERSERDMNHPMLPKDFSGIVL